MSFWERLPIAIKAFLRALWQFRYTLIVLPIVGWFAIRKLEPLLAFVLGAFGGYFQGFVDRCASNYAQLMQSATQHQRAAPASANRMLRTSIAPTVSKARKSRTGIDWPRVGGSVLKGVAWAVPILLLLLAAWNLYLHYYAR